MASLSSGNPTSDAETAIRMLERGQERMFQLRLLLLQTPPGCLADLTWVLLGEASDSVDLALSVLQSGEKAREECKVQAVHSSKSTSDDNSKSKATSGKRRRKMARGDENHQKRGHPNSWTTVTAAPYDDGYQWRKYGQKEIHGAKHPRNYYRCTYRNEQGCPASKQVQQTDNDDPPMFLTSYNHKHTCKNGQSAPHVIVESSHIKQFSLSFETRDTAMLAGQHQPPSLLEMRLQEQEHGHETTANPSHTHFLAGSELMEPVAQFPFNPPEVAEATPTSTTRPSPSSPEIDWWSVDWILECCESDKNVYMHI